jgi:NAD dependent epimerase/dehydratase family enzyme
LILGELAQLVINGQRVIPQKAQAEGFKFDYTTLQQALTQLLAKD